MEKYIYIQKYIKSILVKRSIKTDTKIIQNTKNKIFKRLRRMYKTFAIVKKQNSLFEYHKLKKKYITNKIFILSFLLIGAKR